MAGQMSYLWIMNTRVLTDKNLGPSPKKLSRLPRLLGTLQWHNVSVLGEAGFSQWEVLIRGCPRASGAGAGSLGDWVNIRVDQSRVIISTFP